MADPTEKIKLNPEDFLSPGEKYRLAFERITKAPMMFTRLQKNSGGTYSPPSDLRNMLLSIFKTSPSPAIKVDPYNAESVSGLGGIDTTIRHEAAHSILESIPNIEQMATASEAYPRLKQRFEYYFTGDPTHEVPAYAFSNNPTFQNLDQYTDDITRQIQAAGFVPQARMLGQLQGKIPVMPPQAGGQQ